MLGNLCKRAAPLLMFLGFAWIYAWIRGIVSPLPETLDRLKDEF